MSYFQPALPLLLVLGIWGLVRAWRRSTNGNRPILLTISIVGMVVLSLNVFACLAALPLEIWYDRNSPFPGESAQAIVVLAGSAHAPTPNRPYAFAGSDTYQRVEHAAWLFKHWKAVPILVCGGAFNENAPLAETMKHLLEEEGGIPAEMIWTEGRSKSTHENAMYGSEILREHGISRIAVIIEAISMPRAAASFRKSGFVVVPMPIQFTKLDREVTDVIPTWDAIAQNGETLHEVVGLAWYFLRGWI